MKARGSTAATRDFVTDDELDRCVRATVATILRIRNNQDPRPEDVDAALDHWKRYYLSAPAGRVRGPKQR